MTTKKTTKPDRLTAIKTAAEKQSSPKTEQVIAELEKLVADIGVERDALAARIIELENKISLDLKPTNDLLTGLVSEQPNVVVNLKAFLSECLRTGTFNSTQAAELLRR